jgi:hypothetical protein
MFQRNLQPPSSGEKYPEIDAQDSMIRPNESPNVTPSFPSQEKKKIH